jgi:hypothetical protein
MATKKKTAKAEDKGSNEYNFGSKELMKFGGKSRGFEAMDASDIIVPQLKLLQALSPLVQEYPEKYKQGAVVDSGSEIIIAEPGKDFYVQFIRFHKNRILWIPKTEGGGIRCMSSNAKFATTGEFASEIPGGRMCSNCPFSMWENDADENNKSPKCTLYYNYALLYYGDLDEDSIKDVDPTKTSQMLSWVSFGRTNMKEGKKLLNSLQVRGDIFSHWIKIRSEKTSSAAGLKFWKLKPIVSEPVNDSVLETGNNAYNFLIDMIDSVKFGEDQQENFEGGGENLNDEVV